MVNFEKDHCVLVGDIHGDPLGFIYFLESINVDI